MCQEFVIINNKAMNRVVLYCFVILHFLICDRAYSQELEDDQSKIVINNSNINSNAVRIIDNTLDKYSTGQLKRHKSPDVPKISKRFQLSPKDISELGTESNGSLTTWAGAMGYIEQENNAYNEPPTVSNPQKGCAAYKGPSNNDSPGAWRVPSIRELCVILILNKKIPFESKLNSNNISSYWSSTENITNNYQGAYIGSETLILSNNSKTDKYKVRCIKDLAP